MTFEIVIPEVFIVKDCTGCGHRHALVRGCEGCDECISLAAELWGSE